MQISSVCYRMQIILFCLEMLISTLRTLFVYQQVHFTPVSELSGESNSAYCIRNHFKLIGEANADGGQFTFDDMAEIVDFMYKQWGVFSICDLVYNHMANDAEFLEECPEATYNMVSSPHLIPAFVLDRVFAHATLDIGKGLYESRGISRERVEHASIETVRVILRSEQIPRVNFFEFFVVDVTAVMEQIEQVAHDELERINNKQSRVIEASLSELWQELRIIQDDAHRRLKSTVDLNLVKKISHLELVGLASDIRHNQLVSYEQKTHPEMFNYFFKYKTGSN